MAQTYTYSVSVDFPNEKVAPDRLTNEIDVSSISSGVLQCVNVCVSDADNCDIIFDVALSAPDVTTLDGLVAAHQGVPLPTFPTVSDTAKTWRLEGASGDGVVLLQLRQTNISGEWLCMQNAIDETHVVEFWQSTEGHPRMVLHNAAGFSKVKIAPEEVSYIISTAFGIGTDVPDSNYGVDIVGDVNTDSGYLIDGTVIVNSSRDLTNVRTVSFGSEYSNGSQSGPTYTVDWNNGQKQTIILTGNITTLTLTAPAGVGNFLLRIVQDGTGSRTITWPASVKWVGGVAPTLSIGGDAEDIVTFYYNGTDYYGVVSLNFS